MLTAKTLIRLVCPGWAHIILLGFSCCGSHISRSESLIWMLISTDGQLMGLIGEVLKLTCPRPRLLSYGRKSGRKLGRSSVQGIVRRSCSINVDPEQIPGNYQILCYADLWNNILLM